MLETAQDLVRLLRRARRVLTPLGVPDIVEGLDDAIRQISPIAMYRSEGEDESKNARRLEQKC